MFYSIVDLFSVVKRLGLGDVIWHSFCLRKPQPLCYSERVYMPLLVSDHLDVCIIVVHDMHFSIIDLFSVVKRLGLGDVIGFCFFDSDVLYDSVFKCVGLSIDNCINFRLLDCFAFTHEEPYCQSFGVS